MADEAQLDAIARANAFAVYNGITTHQTGDGTAEASLEIGPDSLNPYGLLHGGASVSYTHLTLPTILLV